ncbi:MAG: methyl-accepting chemotaxis protein [bacterium]|nr:methyl-accepting chemotaxis protein [bacterium]
MKLGPKLMSGFLIVALIATVIGVIGYVNLNNLAQISTRLYEERMKPTEALNTIGVGLEKMRGDIYRYIYVPSTRSEMAQSISERIQDINQCSDEYRKLNITDREKEILSNFSTSWPQMQQGYMALERAADAENEAELNSLLADASYVIQARKATIGALKNLSEVSFQEADKLNQQASSSASSASTMMIIAMIAGIALAIGFGIILSRSITLPMTRGVKMMQEMSQGHLSNRLNLNRGDEIGELTQSMDQFADDLQNVVIGTMKKIADGDVSMEIKAKDNQDEITPAMKQMIESLRGLIAEANMLSQAAVQGKLEIRGQANNFKGAYRDIVQGFNNTLDAVIKPLNMAADYVQRISKGEIPPKITDNYQGDFNLIKENLNTCIEVLDNLRGSIKELCVNAWEGRLKDRADSTKYQGTYEKIVRGINEMMDNLTKPINEATLILEKVAQGDLSTSMSGEYKGDHAVIKNALNSTLDALNDILGNVALAVDQITAGSQQVSDSSQSLSQGATESASSLEEISSSMQEMASQTKLNAENATQANQLTSSARKKADEGNTQMKQMLGAMSDINESSGSISKIIKVIDEIAFQTNLLALNAAVEAARAGVHGKGFAVVAEEVRNLAQRSAKAAKETTEMIEGSIKKVEKGTDIANVTAKALGDIVEGITKVTDLVSEIAAASNEQAQGIEQTTQALGQIDQVTQSNTANAEESASASEELSSQALQLKQMLSRFQLRNDNSSGPVSYSARAPVRQAAPRVPTAAYEPKAKNIKRNKPPVGQMTADDVMALDDTDFGKF